jgi:hypothetical protein
VRELPAGRVVHSLPRAGQVCAAQITAELGPTPSLARWRPGRRRRPFPHRGPARRRPRQNGDRRRPRHQGPGKSRGVVCRFACNKRLRAAVTGFADTSPGVRISSPRKPPARGYP